MGSIYRHLVFLLPLFVSFLTVLFERWFNNRDK